MKRVRAAAVSALACLLLAACGQADREPTGPPPASPPVTSPAPSSPPLASPTPSNPPLASPAPATPPPSLGTQPDHTVGPAKPVTISGTVQEGVEAGCLVLDGYLLIGGRDQGVRAGAKVTVTGRAQPNLMTTCQQGTPLQVETVRPG
jgi:hypothetical protein